jgi:hypothetical protein
VNDSIVYVGDRPNRRVQLFAPEQVHQSSSSTEPGRPRVQPPTFHPTRSSNSCTWQTTATPYCRRRSQNLEVLAIRKEAHPAISRACITWPWILSNLYTAEVAPGTSAVHDQGLFVDASAKR